MTILRQIITILMCFALLAQAAHDQEDGKRTRMSPCRVLKKLLVAVGILGMTNGETNSEPWSFSGKTMADYWERTQIHREDCAAVAKVVPATPLQEMMCEAPLTLNHVGTVELSATPDGHVVRFQNLITPLESDKHDTETMIDWARLFAEDIQAVKSTFDLTRLKNRDFERYGGPEHSDRHWNIEITRSTRNYGYTPGSWHKDGFHTANRYDNEADYLVFTYAGESPMATEVIPDTSTPTENFGACPLGTVRRCKDVLVVDDNNARHRRPTPGSRVVGAKIPFLRVKFVRSSRPFPEAAECKCYDGYNMVEVTLDNDLVVTEYRECVNGEWNQLPLPTTCYQNEEQDTAAQQNEPAQAEAEPFVMLSRNKQEPGPDQEDIALN